MSELRVAILLLAVLVVAGCADDGEADAGEVLPATPLPAEQDPGLLHVHGLGVNPEDGQVYAATHFGLWRLGEGGDAERVGDAAHDLMGFTIVDADHFVASGHPLFTEELPPFDGGRTWEPIDGPPLTRLTWDDPDHLWGLDLDGTLWHTDDAGTSWEQIGAVAGRPEALTDAGGRLVAAADGTISESVDGGVTWTELYWSVAP